MTEKLSDRIKENEGWLNTAKEQYQNFITEIEKEKDFEQIKPEFANYITHLEDKIELMQEVIENLKGKILTIKSITDDQGLIIDI